MAKRSEEVWARCRALIWKQQRSGQSVAVFCRERGIGDTHFFEWRRKVIEAEAKAGRFVEVRLAPAQSQAVLVGLELYYGNVAAARGATTAMTNIGNVRKQKILPLGVARSFDYTGGGRLLSKAVARTAEQVLTVCQGDWSGSQCTGRFDGAGRPLRKSYSDGTEGVTYEYL